MRQRSEISINARYAATVPVTLIANCTSTIALPRSQGGPDTLENLITLCDLCHAVVTKRWHRPWFGEGALWGRDLLGQAREDYMWFLSLDPQERVRIQTAIWSGFGVLPPTR